MATRLRLTPLPIVLLVASFLAPTELSLYVAGLRLPPHRIALLLILPFAIARLFQRRGPRLGAADAAVALFTAWSVFALTYHGTGTSGLVFASSLALECLGAYLAARAYVRNEQDFRGTLATLVLAIAIAALIALPETLLGRHFTHDAMQSLTGYIHPRALERRMGLLRAYGTFDHPIHLGTFAASLAALVWCASPRLSQRFIGLSVVGAATLAALSSAPMLCLALQIGLLIYERATRGLPSRTFLSLAGLALAFALISLVATRSPFALIATGFTLDPWTGYYRLLIWEYGIAALLANPVLGIGLAEWERPHWMYSETVDAFWLLIAMRTGFPGIVLMLAAVALAIRTVWRASGPRAPRPIQRIARGWIVALVAMSLAAATVHLWNVVHTYYFFFLGLAGWIADPARLGQSAVVRPTAPSDALSRRRSRWSESPAAAADAVGCPGQAFRQRAAATAAFRVSCG